MQFFEKNNVQKVGNGWLWWFILVTELLWANFDDYRECMHQFYGHFFCPEKHMYCTHFMEDILSGMCNICR